MLRVVIKAIVKCVAVKTKVEKIERSNLISYKSQKPWNTQGCKTGLDKKILPIKITSRGPRLYRLESKESEAMNIQQIEIITREYKEYFLCNFFLLIFFFDKRRHINLCLDHLIKI